MRRKIFRLLIVATTTLSLLSCSTLENSETSKEESVGLGKDFLGTWICAESRTTDGITPSSEWMTAAEIDIRYYHFLKNGEGYVERFDAKYDGIYRKTLTWRTGKGTLSVEEKSLETGDISQSSYLVEDGEDDELILHDASVTDGLKYKEWKFERISTTELSGSSYKQKPYENYVYGNGFYYELETVIMQADHSTSTTANSKSLIFYGTNGLMKPTGLHFNYFTPYYDGIEREWYPGTYYCVPSSEKYYTYIVNIVNYRNYNHSNSDGTLIIKRSGGIYTLDFENEDGDRGHFVGTIQ